MTDAQPFVAMLRRLIHSKYKKLYLLDRQFLQCYNLDIDKDVGLHYMMPIPDSYAGELYDMEFGLAPDKVLATYKEGHTFVDTIRKERNMKPKEIHEEVHLSDSGALKFMFYLGDDLMTTTKIKVEYPIDEESSDIRNIVKTYENLRNRIKPGGMCLRYNGLKKDLYNRILNTPEIYFYRIKRPEMRVRVPFCRSMFAGLTKPTKFIFTVQETLLPDVYVLTITLGKSKLEEIFWGYIVNF